MVKIGKFSESKAAVIIKEILLYIMPMSQQNDFSITIGFDDSKYGWAIIDWIFNPISYL